MAGVVGGAALTHMEGHALGLVGSLFILAALGVAEAAHRQMARPRSTSVQPHAIAAGSVR